MRISTKKEKWEAFIEQYESDIKKTDEYVNSGKKWSLKTQKMEELYTSIMGTNEQEIREFIVRFVKDVKGTEDYKMSDENAQKQLIYDALEYWYYDVKNRTFLGMTLLKAIYPEYPDFVEKFFGGDLATMEAVTGKLPGNRLTCEAPTALARWYQGKEKNNKC